MGGRRGSQGVRSGIEGAGGAGGPIMSLKRACRRIVIIVRGAGVAVGTKKVRWKVSAVVKSRCCRVEILGMKHLWRFGVISIVVMLISYIFLGAYLD